MKMYKLTNQDLTTYEGCQWTLGEWKETSGEGELCNDGWLHCYSDPLLAILFIPIHANIENPKLFEAECEGKRKDDGQLKSGFSRMRLVKEIEVPEITITQRIAFGILCAQKVYKEKKWNKWARNWLDNIDRTAEAAWAAAEAEWAAAWAAEAAAEGAATAAWAAARAAAEAAAAWAAETAAHKRCADIVRRVIRIEWEEK